jgi:hypothetical protein
MNTRGSIVDYFLRCVSSYSRNPWFRYVMLTLTPLGIWESKDTSRACHLGGCGGCNTPKKVKNGGPTCGEGALACWNCKIFKNEGFLRWKFWKFLEKSCFAKDFGNFCFRKNNVDLPPPPSPSPKFSGNIFAFRGAFLGGPWNGRGPTFWNTPPQPETGWHGPGHIPRPFTDYPHA